MNKWLKSIEWNFEILFMPHIIGLGTFFSSFFQTSGTFFRKKENTLFVVKRRWNYWSLRELNVTFGESLLSVDPLLWISTHSYLYPDIVLV